MATLTWITGKELERELNNNGDQLRWKKSIKVLQQRFENEKCQRGYQKNRNTSISSVKRVNRKVKVNLFPQNNGKEMYQKVCCTCKVVFFLLIRKTIALHVQIRSIAVVFKRSLCFLLVFSISRFYIFFEESKNQLIVRELR